MNPADHARFKQLTTLLDAPDLKTVVDAYMTHAGYRQLASRDDLPAEVRRGALGAFLEAHARALDTLRSRAFTDREAKAVTEKSDAESAPGAESLARVKP